MNTRAINPLKVAPVGEENPVLLEHGVHRLMLATNWIPVEPKPDGELLLSIDHPERSSETEANLVLTKEMDVSFKPLCFPLWLNKYCVT